MASLPLHAIINLQLPWSSTVEDDKRFTKILWGAFLLLALVSIPVSLVTLPEIQRAEKEKLPPQLARILLERQELPPPKPVEPPKPEPKVEEPKPEVKKPEVEVKPVERPVAVKPQPKPTEQQPVPDNGGAAVARAREQASNSGVMQFKDDLAEMREMMQTSAVETAATTVTNSTGEAAQVDRAMITSNAKVASGGINTAAMSRDTGGVALSGRETTRVTSNLANTGNKAGVAATGNPNATGRAGAGNSDGASGAAARSEEEIRKVMEQHKGAIYSIYNRALRQNPALQGKMVVKIVIDPNGRIVEATMVSSELGDPALESRILQRIKLITFSASNVLRTTLNQTFDFLPQ